MQVQVRIMCSRSLDAHARTVFITGHQIVVVTDTGTCTLHMLCTKWISVEASVLGTRLCRRLFSEK